MVDAVPSSTSASLGSPTRIGKAITNSDDNIHNEHQQSQHQQQQRQQLLVEKGLSSPSIDSRPPRNNHNNPTSNNSIVGDTKHNNWMSSSPFSQLGAISPGSAMSFSPGTFAFSPIPNGKYGDEENVFSPSIFSPSPLKSTKVLKKRDCDIGSGPDGIAELQMNDGKPSHSSSVRPTANDYLEISNLIMPNIRDPFAKTYGGENLFLDESEEGENQIDVGGTGSTSRKRPGASTRRLNLDSVDEFSMNFLDDITSSTPLQIPESRLYAESRHYDEKADLNIESFNSGSNRNKKTKLSSKSPARNNNQYYSSPATILRPTVPANMSPDMVNGVIKGGCNCKRSKCLKLYCECFKAQQYCSGCDCVDCNNLAFYEGIRQEAIRATKERNATAFQPKVIMKDKNAEHNAGCNCKKSRCIKKYCECFEGSVLCSSNCKCVNCLNDGKSNNVSKDKDKNEEPSSITTSLVTPRKPVSDGERSNYDDVNSTNDTDTTMNENNLVSTPHLDVTKMRRSLSANQHTNSTNSGMKNSYYNLKKRNAEKVTGDNNKETDTTTPNLVIKKKASITKSSTSETKASSNITCNNNHNDSSENSKGNGNDNNDNNSGSEKPSSQKQRKVKFTKPKEPVYEFFGPSNPHTTKLTALRCLDFLEDKDIITMSQVNKLWSIAAMDDALWE